MSTPGPREGKINNNMLDTVMANQKISVSDVCSSFRQPINKNEKPYTLAVKKANNKFIDDWKQDVLDNRSIDTKLQAIAVHKFFDSYKTGIEVNAWRDANSHFTESVIGSESKGKEKVSLEVAEGSIDPIPPNTLQVFPRMTSDQVRWWKEFFDADIEKMHSYGFMVVNLGWMYITNEIRLAFTEEKWRRVYGKSNDPVYWLDHYGALDLIENAGFQPFGWSKEQFEDIREKVSTICNSQIAPRS